MRVAIPPKLRLAAARLAAALAQRRGAAAGLVIHAHEVEVLALRGREAPAHVRVPVEGGEEHHLRVAIQRAIGQAKLVSKRLIVSLPGKESLLRFFTIPAVPPAEREASVRFEVRKYIPFKPEELVWDYQATLTRQPGRPGQLEVVFAAVLRDRFQGLHTILVDAGAQAVRLEPRSVSLARLTAGEPAAPAGACICLIDLSAQGAHLVIARDGVPWLARDLTWPDAQAGAGRSEERDAGQARFARLVGELNMSASFVAREYPGTSVAKVILVGEDELAASCHAWLSKALSVPVELGHGCLQRLGTPGLPLRAAAAAGLMAPEPRGASIDFLRHNVARQQGPAHGRPLAAALPAWAAEPLAVLKSAAGMAISAGVLALLLGWWALLARADFEQARRVASLQQGPAGLPGAVMRMGLEELEAFRDQIQQRLSLLERVSKERVGAAEKLDGLARALPDGIWITGMSFSDPFSATGQQARLTIHGACYLGPQGGEREQQAIYALEQELRRSTRFIKGFETARVEQINASQDGTSQATYRTFQLHCAAQGTGGG